MASASQAVTILPPKIKTAVFEIIGDSPLVIHRFSAKTKKEMADKQSTGKSSSSKKTRVAQPPEDVYNEARYRSKEGWDGFNAAAIRAAMIDACRLINFKMTLAKMSVFVEPDGWDADEPQIGLIRIIGKPIMQKDMARVMNDAPYVTIRPAYHGWRANVRIRWDTDQFSFQDICHLLMRAGQQVGIGEGRPFSKNSGGMGWGIFHLGKNPTDADTK